MPDYRQGTDGFFYIILCVVFIFMAQKPCWGCQYGFPVWSFLVWDTPPTSVKKGQQARSFARKRCDFIKLLHILSSFSDLLEGSRSPHQFVDHVDRDPHEGWKANDVSNRDAPVWVLVVKQGQLRRLEQGAHYDVLRRVGAHEEFVKYCHNASHDQTLQRGCKWYI